MALTLRAECDFGDPQSWTCGIYVNYPGYLDMHHVMQRLKPEGWTFAVEIYNDRVLCYCPLHPNGDPG